MKQPPEQIKKRQILDNQIQFNRSAESGYNGLNDMSREEIKYEADNQDGPSLITPPGTTLIKTNQQIRDELPVDRIRKIVRKSPFGEEAPRNNSRNG